MYVTWSDDSGCSYSTVVLYIKNWVQPKISIKPVSVSLHDSLAALVRFSQAQKCLWTTFQNVSMELKQFFYLTEFYTDKLMPPVKYNLIMDKATGLISSPFDVTSSQDVPFCQLLYVK